MKLSPNFTLEEMTRTSYPWLQKEPSVQAVVNLTRLCALVLQPLRDAIGCPVRVTSGFRSERLNDYVGGVADSYHRLGLAADIHVNDDAHARRMFDVLKTNPYVDVCLFEHKNGARWLHVQTSLYPRHKYNFNYIP